MTRPSGRVRAMQGRISIDPDAAPSPPRDLEPPTAAGELEPTPSPLEAAPATAPPGRARARKPAAARKSALEDPSIRPGEMGYRSFYLEDSVYARFRAAVYWTARHPDADGDVPENMSSGVEAWMREMADDLERRFNGGEVFRMPPGERRSKGKPG